MKRIETVQASIDEGTVRVEFRDGTSLELDRGELIEKGGVFENLADDEYFEGAIVLHDGLTLQWPGDEIIDLFAPTLWEKYAGDESEDDPSKKPAV